MDTDLVGRDSSLDLFGMRRQLRIKVQSPPAMMGVLFKVALESFVDLEIESGTVFADTKINSDIDSRFECKSITNPNGR